MDEMEYKDSLTRSKVVPCELYPGEKRRVYMIVDKQLKDGSYLYQPNGCDDYVEGSEACHKCLVLMAKSFKAFVDRQSASGRE